MKRFITVLSILALLPTLAFATAGVQAPIADPEERAPACQTAEPALFEAEEIELADLNVCDPYPQYIDCDHWTSSFCTYGWNRCRGCCEASYIAPGAACPDICQ